MLPRHHPDRIRIAFDDHRLVTNGNVSSFYPPDVNSGKNSGVFAGPLAEFFPLWKKAGHKACCLSGWLNPGPAALSSTKTAGPGSLVGSVIFNG